MSAQLSQELPATLRRRGEIVGIICGILAYPFAFYGETLGAMLPVGPAGVVLPIVLCSTLAGIIACAFGRGAEGETAAGFAPRIGIRAGLVATVAGGALTVFAATLHAFGIGHPAENGGWLTLFALVLPRTRPFQVFVITLLGIPPAIFFGMAGAFITAMLRNPPPPSAAGGAGPASHSHPARSAFFAVVLVLSAIGYLSPFAVLLRQKPKLIVVAPVAPPIVKPPPPPPPKWSYRKSEYFDAAEAQNIESNDRRMLGEIAAELPVALAPDGRNFAFCVRRDNAVSVEIRDLETLDSVGRCALAAEPTSFAWSPDSKRLLFVTEQKGRHIAVFDPAENRLYPLPQPKNARLPEGVPWWWEATEVLFLIGNKVVTTLDLESLRAHPIEENAKWKTLSKEQQDEVQRRPSVHLSSTPRWSMALRSLVHDYDVPPKTQPWITNEILQFALVHPLKSYVRIFPNINARVGDSFVAAPDGTKVVRVRNQQAEVFYFDTRMPPALACRVTMPNAPETSLSDLLAKKMLCVFFCAPLVNPLNGKTVGPDRDRVKALGRIAKWSEKNADVWIDEEYFPVQSGDVIADLHTWDERNPKGAGELARSEWWTAIETVSPSSAIPTRKETPLVERGFYVTVNSTRGADHLDSIDTARLRRQSPTQVAPVILPVTPPPPPVIPQPMPVIAPRPAVQPEPKPIPPRDNPATIVRRFMAAHFDRDSRGDSQGYANDFSDPVDYYTRGMTARAVIFQQAQNAQAEYTKITATVKSMNVTQLSPTTFEASCVVEHVNVKNGAQSGGTSTTSSTVTLTPDGPKIIKIRLVKK